jgi:hypothetical protein
MKGLASCAVGGMECRIVAISTASSADFPIAVRTCKSGIQHNFLQTLAILALEIPDKRIISLPVRETIFFKTF